MAGGNSNQRELDGSGPGPGRQPSASKKYLAGFRGLYQKREWFYFQPPTPKGGKRPGAVALKTKNLIEALERMTESRHELALERAVIRGTLAEVLPAYFEAKRRDAKSTRLAREVILKSFAKHAGNPKVESVSAEMVSDWLDAVAAGAMRKVIAKKSDPKAAPKAASKATIKSYTITLRAFLNWAVREGIIRESPLQQDSWKRESRVSVTKVQGFLTVEERERLLAAEAPEHARLVLHLGFFAGLREGETLAVHNQWLWLDDDGERGSITVQDTPIRFTDGSCGTWQPKGRRRRKVPLHPRLLAYLKEHPPGEGWWVAPDKVEWPGEEMNSKRFDTRKALAGVAKRAGVKHLTCHMLRHSFATHLAMKGVALAEIAALLGDSIKVTEDHYAGFCPSRVNPLDGI